MSLRKTTHALLFAIALFNSARAQEPLRFEVAAVKPNKSDTQAHSVFPLGPGDVYGAKGGLLSAVNFPLLTYITFAYRIMGSQAVFLMPQIPQWVKDEHYDIQARAEGSPSKDEMRAMMRALLAERFGLEIHTETRQVPVFFLVLATPGKTGPRLRMHPADAPCPAPKNADEEFPATCGGIYAQTASAPNHLRIGARNIDMKHIAESFPTLDLGRPVIDKTGLTGYFDFTIDWALETRDPREPGLAGVPDPLGPDFTTALKEQLGLKLQAQKGPVDVLIVDRIQHPTEN